MANPKEVLSKAMTNMAKPKKSKNKLSAEVSMQDSNEDIYPYNLKITLDKDSLKSLGLSAEEFSVGGNVMLNAKCDVVSTRIEKGTKRTYESVDLQITDIGIVTK